jgi:hypothetical protein
MRGMSGGPVFGFKNRPAQAPLYGLVAVQSWWDRERRLAFGTRFDIFIELLANTFREFDDRLARG